MYHYRECGLPNVHLANGYREVETAYGPAVAIEDVEGLHRAIAQDLVEGKSALTGAEVRFIRKFLDLTQVQLGEFAGVEDQTVRNWERGRDATVPTQADRAIRLIFRDITRRLTPSLPELIEQVTSEHLGQETSFRYEPDAREHWTPERQAA